MKKTTLGRKIGQIKGLQTLDNGIYNGTWGGYIATIKNKPYKTNLGVKHANLSVIIKCKDGICSIHEIKK